MGTEWYYETGGIGFGPLPSSELKRLAQIGKVRPGTRVKKGVEGKWVLAERVKGLFDAPESDSDMNQLVKDVVKFEEVAQELDITTHLEGCNPKIFRQVFQRNRILTRAKAEGVYAMLETEHDELSSQIARRAETLRALRAFIDENY